MPPTAESGFFVLEDFWPLNTDLFFIKDGTLKTLRDTLLFGLMSGEVRVAWIPDPPSRNKAMEEDSKIRIFQT